MNKKVFKIEVTLAFTIVILSLITISYGAFYGVNKKQPVINITAACFNTTFSDGQSINMSGAMPLSDNEGMYKEPYEFSLINNCEYDMSYDVTVDVPLTSIDNSNIKFMFNSSTIGVVGSQASTGELPEYQKTRLIGHGIIKAGTKITSELRFWLDENTDIETVKTKSWNGQIKIISKVKEA